MKLPEFMVFLALTSGAAVGTAVALDVPKLVTRTNAVAQPATCRAVDLAILVYITEHDVAPATLADLTPYVRGDISAYRIVGGVTTGPGCPTPAPAR